MNGLIFYVIPLFAVTVAFEAWWASRRAARAAVPSPRGYAKRDTAASLTLGAGNVVVGAAVRTFTVALWFALYEHRLFDIPRLTWWSLALLVLCEDACYYVFHRASHRVRLLWAAHVNHHSSEHFNLSTALRQSWTTPFTALPFWLPLPLLGFDPTLVILARGASTLYQYGLHTEWIGRLGLLEGIINTPSNHRVHHSRRPEHLDRNFAGMFMIWDRLLGTYVPEERPVDFGIQPPLRSYNPVTIAFHEWRSLGREAARARSWAALADALVWRRPAATEGATTDCASPRSEACGAYGSAVSQRSP